jgi:hypothetical protein
LAIGWIYLKYLYQRGVFRNGDAQVLDIGCQNLFDVPRDEGLEFLNNNGARANTSVLTPIVEDIHTRSKWPNWDVFAYDFLKHTTIEYVSYDIFAGPKTRIFDLNFEDVPQEHVGAFDAVLNFGTTEHVFNQYNAFKVIHESARVGGYMFHQVPTVGYINHGYWVYSPMTLFKMAQANHYEIDNFWITGPQASVLVPDADDNLKWNAALPENNRAAWANVPVANGLINILLRKTRGDGFRLPLEQSTTGHVADPDLLKNYTGD